MGRQQHTTEQIVGKLRGPEVALAKGQPVAQVCREFSVTAQTCSRWRQTYKQIRPHERAGLPAACPRDNRAANDVCMTNIGSGKTFGGRSASLLAHQDLEFIG